MEENQNGDETTIEELMSKESWNGFFTHGGLQDLYVSDWYAAWPQLQHRLTPHLQFPSSSSSDVSILVPACGNSRLSEHLYDEGFTNITNVDFSEVVISHMLQRNVRTRPKMKWRVMDLTTPKFNQFPNETFDAIIDKGGLDALMENLTSAMPFISAVKRLLKAGGKYICVTLAEPHVLVQLSRKFCFGWKVGVYATAAHQSSNGHEQPFMVVAEKLVSPTVFPWISLFMDEYSAERHVSEDPAEFFETIQRENMIRAELSNLSDVYVSIADLLVRMNKNFQELEPGRSVKFALGEYGVSTYFYACTLLDARLDSGPSARLFWIYLVPEMHTLKWMLTFPEVQLLLIESCQAARLLMVWLDSINSSAPMSYTLMLLNSYAGAYVPTNVDVSLEKLYSVADNGIKHRTIVHKATSRLNGKIIVEDVIYNSTGNHFPAKDFVIRRLIIGSLVLSEVVLSKKRSIETSNEVKKNEVEATSKSKKKEKRRNTARQREASDRGMVEVKHNYLATLFHSAIISGSMLFTLHLKGLANTTGIDLISLPRMNTVVIGLGAGLLPMFMNNYLPFLSIEVVESDPMILDVAKQYFDFREDERLKVTLIKHPKPAPHFQVHISNEIKFFKERADSAADETCSTKIDILIVEDGLRNNSMSEVYEESFLLALKNSLSEQGLLVLSPIPKETSVEGSFSIYSPLKKVFSNIFSLQVDAINEVIFALKTDSTVNNDQVVEASNVLKELLPKEEWCQKVINATHYIKKI